MQKRVEHELGHRLLTEQFWSLLLNENTDCFPFSGDVVLRSWYYYEVDSGVTEEITMAKSTNPGSSCSKSG